MTTVKTAKPATTQYLHRLLCVTKQVQYKAELVSSFTDGRAESSRDMTEEEAQALIKFIQSGGKQGDSADRMRKKILSYCHQMLWYTEQGKLNYKAIDEYCIKYGHKHKPLNDYTEKELPVLVSQFETMFNGYLKQST